MSPIAHAYLTTGSPYYPYSWLVRIACGFAAGVLVCLAVRRMRATSRRCVLRRGGVLPALIAAGSDARRAAGPGPGRCGDRAVPAAGRGARADRPRARDGAGPAVGCVRRRISYALYLVHIPMFEVYWTALQHVRALGPHTLLAHLAGLAVLVATLGVAAVAYRGVEEPARRRLLSLHRPGGTSLPAGMRAAARLEMRPAGGRGPRRAPRHALTRHPVFAGQHRPAHWVA